MTTQQHEPLAWLSRPAARQPLPRAPDQPLHTPDALHAWVHHYIGVTIPTVPMVKDHSAPFEYLAHTYFEGRDPRLAHPHPLTPSPPHPLSPGPIDCLVWANRGGGKTFMGAVATALDLLHKPGIEVRILAGSLEQAGKMYAHLRRIFERPELCDHVRGRVTNRRITLKNGGTAELLAQSDFSVRGTRVQRLRCDEVELFEPSIWEAAQLTTRSRTDAHGRTIHGTVECLSTMHVPHGLMARLVREAAEGRRRLFKWSLLDVLERCTRGACRADGSDGPRKRCPPDERAPRFEVTGSAPFFGPSGAAECSHGWSEVAEGDRAEPVGSDVVDSAPAGAEEGTSRSERGSSAPSGAGVSEDLHTTGSGRLRRPPPVATNHGPSGAGDQHGASAALISLGQLAVANGQSPGCDCPLLADCAGLAKSTCNFKNQPVVPGHVSIADAIRMKARVSPGTWQAEMLCERADRTATVYPDFDAAIHVIHDDRLLSPCHLAALSPGRAPLLSPPHPFTPSPPHPFAPLPLCPLAPFPGAAPPLLCGMDFGYRAPTVILWGRLDDGVLTILDERVESELILGTHVRALTARRPAWVAIDPAGNARNEQTGVSAADVLRKAGINVKFRRLPVQAGLELIRARLRPADGSPPRLLIHRRCAHLIGALETYHYNEKDPTDLDPVKDGPDHACDALRYLVTAIDQPVTMKYRNYLQ